MGGSSQTKADKAMTAANLARQEEADIASMESEGLFRAQEYKTKREQALQGAELEAGAGVTAERSKLISESGTLLTDWEAQEKERFMKSKRGVGQVGAEDVAITGQARQEALDLLGKGSEYWDARRGAARSEASKAAGLAFGEEFGTEEEYIGKGQLAVKGREAATAKEAQSVRLEGKTKIKSLMDMGIGEEEATKLQQSSLGRMFGG